MQFTPESARDAAAVPLRVSSARTPFLTGALRVLESCWKRADLVLALTRRDVLIKYRGSILGFMWSLVTPLVLLGIYTAVFGLVFRTSWPEGKGGMGEFAVMVFCGLVPFNFYNECLGKAAVCIVLSPGYVKRIAFPTETLPVAMVLSALVHALMSLAVLLIGVALLGRLSPTVLYLPVVLLPVVLSAMTGALVMAAVGVFLRDVGHMINLAFSALMFASPILYPASMVPPRLQFLVFVNPLAYAAANLRKVLVHGMVPQWSSWAAFTGVSLVLLVLAAGYFHVIRRRFADVL
jgi:lipopolysaccharide transport system permease protein